MTSVSLRKIVKSYGQLVVVHGIDLDVASGEFVVLLGPSGCGKTTTLRMVAGLEDISGGSLMIGGREVNDVAPKDRRIAMVFQNYALYPHMTVRQNMEFALKPQGLSASDVAARVDNVSRMLGLEALLERKPAQLSGGQRQRVAMARAMVRTPDVFLFDEPLSNLDAKLRTQVRLEIARLHKALKSTIIYVTHDQIEAMTLADKIVIMRDGHIEQVGTPQDVYNRPRNLFVATFIGSPAMNLVKGTVAMRGDQLVAEAGPIEVSVDRARFARVTPGQDIVIGIRPVDFELGEAGRHGTFEARVDVAEFLGNTMLFDMRAGERELIVELPTSVAPSEGATVALSVRAGAAHLFDAGSGESLSSN